MSSEPASDDASDSPPAVGYGTPFQAGPFPAMAGYNWELELVTRESRAYLDIGRECNAPGVTCDFRLMVQTEKMALGQGWKPSKHDEERACECDHLAANSKIPKLIDQWDAVGISRV